jgi:glycerophosphoryl diester phosphodiesterase
MIIVGHRGAAGHAPENTLLSFQTAINLGCGRTEMDVRLSSDNVAVLIHDKNAKSTTNGKGLIKNKTFAEIKELDCEKGQKIPTLDEAINLCKGKIPLVIELKARGTPAKVNEAIEKNNIKTDTIIISYKRELLKEIKELNPELKVGLLYKDLRNKFFHRSIWNTLKQIPLDYICPRSNLVTKKLVKKAHELNLKVYAFRVNSLKTFKKMEKMGVDEIGTDYPKLFINK